MTRNVFLMVALVLSLMISGFTMAEEPAVQAGVNINTASQEVLAEALDGIGESKAAAIVAYREANGPFESVDDLDSVKGIGAATVDKNRDSVRLK